MDVIKLIKHTGIKGNIVSKTKSSAKAKEVFMLVWLNWLILSDMEWDIVRETWTPPSVQRGAKWGVNTTLTVQNLFFRPAVDAGEGWEFKKMPGQ